MPDDQITDPSSVAAPEAPPMQSWSSEQRSTWLETGKTPKAEPVTPAEVTEETSGAVDETDEPAPASEPAKKQEPKKKGADSRIQELLDERHELRSRLEKLEKGAPKADPPPAKADETKPGKAEAPKRPPKLSEWKGTLDEHEDAMAQWYQDMAKFEARHLLDTDRTERETKAATEKAETEKAKIIKSWSDRREAAKKELADFDTVIKADAPINATTDAFLLKDALGAKILYQLCKDPAEAKRISGLDPFDTMEALLDIKRGLSSDKKQAPIKPTTQAPPPPTELNARSTEPADEADAALNARDFGKYRRIMNARESQR